MELTEKKGHVAILQPSIPHYRQEFFSQLKSFLMNCDIYITDSEKRMKNDGFKSAKVSTKHIKNFQIKKAVVYSPFVLMNNKYDTLVLPLHIGLLTTYLLLLLKPILGKKIILWGHGISIKRYMEELENPDDKIKWMISKSDGIWLYTKSEKELWEKFFPDKPIVALGNTVGAVGDMLSYKPEFSKEELRKQYGIKEEIVFIFCARFIENIRRTDLLIETIERLDPDKYGFIIIGDGKEKPDFSKYSNVYDFGAVFETEKKQNLFSAADIYFQPGWVGLSIVEAMAYSLPVFTFKRSKKIMQCVEYGYIENKYNGLIFNDLNECVTTIKEIDKVDIDRMANNARRTVKQNLTTEKMVFNAVSII